MSPHVRAGFIDPMLLLRADTLPNDPRWSYELKLDGYRAIAFRAGRTLHLRSRNDNDFSVRYPSIASGLANLPADTAIDGEVVALDKDGRPSFQLLQNYGASAGPLVFFVFDIMMLAGKNVMGEPLATRRQLLDTKVLPKLGEPVRQAPALMLLCPS